MNQDLDPTPSRAGARTPSRAGACDRPQTTDIASSEWAILPRILFG
jgi:hypothetical protein